MNRVANLPTTQQSTTQPFDFSQQLVFIHPLMTPQSNQKDSSFRPLPINFNDLQGPYHVIASDPQEAQTHQRVYHHITEDSDHPAPF